MPKKRKVKDAEGVRADVVGSEGTDAAAEAVRDEWTDEAADAARAEEREETVYMSSEIALKAVVTLVACKGGKQGVVLEDWVKAVLGKLDVVGITNVRELVEGILTLNQRLRRERKSALHDHTVQALLMEAVDLVNWPEAGEAAREAGSEGLSE
jgi:hypothetical protein